MEVPEIFPAKYAKYAKKEKSTKSRKDRFCLALFACFAGNLMCAEFVDAVVNEEEKGDAGED